MGRKKAQSLEKIAALQGLRQGWDRQGGPALKEIALYGASEIVNQYQTDALPEPNIGPVIGGGIQLEWSTPTRELEVELLPDGSVVYVSADNTTCEVDDGRLNTFASPRIPELINWVGQRQTK